MGRHGTTFEQRLRMDEYTISNWSLWMDFHILMKTVWVVLGGKGAQAFMRAERLDSHRHLEDPAQRGNH